MSTETATEIETVRISSLPLAFACPGSLRGDVRVDTPNEAAGLGSAAHATMREVVERELDEPPENLDRYAAEYACDEDELRFLTWNGVKMWREFRQYFPNPVCEDEITDGNVTGHPDILGCEGAVGAVLDWKSGRVETLNEIHQIKGYASALAEIMELDEITGIVAWLREKAFRSWRWTRDELDRWMHEEVYGRIFDWDGKFTVGQHCAYCPRQHDCPARKTMIQGTVAELLPDLRPQGVIAPADLISLHERVSVLKAGIDRYGKWLAAELAMGPITANGQRLEQVPVTRQSIDAQKGWATFMEHLTEAELAPAVTISKGKLVTAVRAKAERGKKKGAQEAFMAELKAADAIKESSYTKVQLSRVERAIEGGE